MEWTPIENHNVWLDWIGEEDDITPYPETFPCMASLLYGTEVVFFYLADAVELLQCACDLLEPE